MTSPQEVPTETTLGKQWRRKMIIFIVVVIAFGTWGLWDAVVAYPKRGERFASFAEFQYLQAAQAANEEDRGIFIRESSVPEPRAELDRLRDRERQSRNAEAAADTNHPRHRRATMQIAREQWLTGLSRIGRLDPEHTTFEDPRARMEELGQRWQGESAPSALRAYDIPSQWLIMGVCYAVGIYLIALFIRVAGRRYRWDPESKTLAFPDGATISPDDLAEVDKRKWDKFIVFLRTKDDAQSLPGQTIRIDTYRYAHLEGWILDMERAAGLSEEDVGPTGDADSREDAETRDDDATETAATDPERSSS